MYRRDLLKSVGGLGLLLAHRGLPAQPNPGPVREKGLAQIGTWQDTRNSPDLLELLKNYVGRGRHQQHQKLGWWLKRGTGRVIYGKRLLVRAVGSHQKEYCVVDV